MAWKETDLKRSYVCNREMLKFFRERKGWSQQQLCDQSGVSVRVVSKGEAGNPISNGSIDKLATAFSIPEYVVYPEDLISHPTELAKQFVTALYSEQKNFLNSVGEIIDADAIFRVVGDPKKIPFAGLHRGPRAYRRAVKKFFQIFEIEEGLDHAASYEYFPKGTEVVLWGTSRLKLIGSELPPTDVSFRKRFRFRRGLLYSFEDHHNISQSERKVARAVRFQGSRVFDSVDDSSLGTEKE